MPDLELATMDLADGLKLKKVHLPPTKVDVVIQGAPTDLVKAAQKDKLILQTVIAAAFESLKASRKEFQTAMRELDAKFEKTPLTNEKDLAQRAETMQVMYKQIATAQGTAAAKAAETAWQAQQKKKSDLKSFRLKILATTLAGTLSIAASVTAAVMSMGSLAGTIYSAAKTVASMASALYDYCRDIASTEKDIVDSDKVIGEIWKKNNNGGKIVGRELADALGAPYIRSVGGMRKLLLEYNAKIAKGHSNTEKMWKEAKSLMAEIDKLPDGVGDKAQKTKLEQATTKLLDQISDVMTLLKAQDKFHEEFEKRLARYDKLQADLGTAKLGPGADLLLQLSGLASTAETILKIAEKLA